ncbi:MAG: D-alanyl-D-alanine carboxypeptidase [Ruminococcus sp.]|nr:D-alanyl-D-alanine carboxypeptidase [Ruminococcus sp.]
MKFLKRLCLAVAAVLTVTAALPFAASALTFTPSNGKDDNDNPVPILLYSKSIYMIDLSTGAPLVDINSTEKLSPGYLTQLMTCCMILDKFGGNEKQLKNTYVYGTSEAYDELYDTGAPTADIRPYEEVSYYDLIVSMVIASSCEAANITAMNLADSLFDFSLKMNDKAAELGMTDTKFSSAHGFFTLQNYSTAKDMAKLCKYIVDKYPVFHDICSKEYMQLEATEEHPEGTNLYTNNYIVSTYSDYYYAAAEGIKISNREDSGRCLASYAETDGSKYLIVSLGAPIEKTPADMLKGEQDPDSIYGSDNVYYNILDHISLYRWAFNSLTATDFINPNSEVTEAPVEFGEGADYVNLKPAKGYTALWPVDLKTDDVEKKVTVFENIIAPVEKGDVLGKMVLEYHGEQLASIDLVATSSVKRSKSSSTIKIMLSFFRSQEFKWALFIIIMMFSVYGIAYFMYLQLKYLKINKKE